MPLETNKKKGRRTEALSSYWKQACRKKKLESECALFSEATE